MAIGVITKLAKYVSKIIAFFESNVSVKDFGAVGDGVVNDSAAFASLEAQYTGNKVDLLGKTYLVTSPPELNQYENGWFKRSSDGYVFESNLASQLSIGNKNILMGAGAGAAMPKYVQASGGNPYSNIGIGFNTLHRNLTGRINLALGDTALFSLQAGRYNVAIGGSALFSVNSNDGGVLSGTRNTVIGSNGMRFVDLGYSNCGMGRNVGQCLTTGFYNTLIGTGAQSGDAPLDLDDLTILNNTPITASKQVSVGADAGRFCNADGNVNIGYRAGYDVKKGSVIAIGLQAGENLEIGSSYNGFQRFIQTKTGTYSWVDNTVTVTIAAHGFSKNWTTYIRIGSHEFGYRVINEVEGANTFTFNTPYLPKSGNESGTVEVREWVTLTPVTPLASVIAIGRQAMKDAGAVSSSVAIGDFSLQFMNSNNNVGVGVFAVTGSSTVGGTGKGNSGVGYSTLRNLTTGSDNVAIGEFAGTNITTGARTTSLGQSAGRTNIDGSNTTVFNNITALGAGARISGDNQVQLGDSATTTYAYGTVQNRSDARDKADQRDTVLGLEFINSLRPVDYKWDMREDYAETIIGEDGEETIVQHEKDGSKVRNRFHHGFIAQEVAQVIRDSGVDFGGFQDHSIHGGCEVQSLGYDEFIAPMVKAIQELTARVKELEAR